VEKLVKNGKRRELCMCERECKECVNCREMQIAFEMRILESSSEEGVIG
jgi:hypothetical protein